MLKQRISLDSYPDEYVAAAYCEGLRFINWVTEGYYEQGDFHLIPAFDNFSKCKDSEYAPTMPLVPEHYEITDFIRNQNGVPSKQSLIDFRNSVSGKGVRNFMSLMLFHSNQIDIHKIKNDDDKVRRWIVIEEKQKEHLVVEKEKFKCSCPIENNCIHIKALHLNLMAENPETYQNDLPDSGHQDIFKMQKKIFGQTSGARGKKRGHVADRVIILNEPSTKKRKTKKEKDEKPEDEKPKETESDSWAQLLETDFDGNSSFNDSPRKQTENNQPQIDDRKTLQVLDETAICMTNRNVEVSME
uniref:SWIM-type domain-containing protein n=1 Tax=Panagrolaimus sp. JU765 TaxID=591449 RepID=A0AC34QZA5_9BILA